MGAHTWATRLLVGLTGVVLVGGCAAGATSPPFVTPTPTSVPPTALATAAAVPAPTPTVAATSLRTPTPSTIKVKWDVPYESANPVLTPDALDSPAAPRAASSPATTSPRRATGTAT
jgi:hypothetical protein